MKPISGKRYVQRNGQLTGPLRELAGKWKDAWTGRVWNLRGECEVAFDYDIFGTGE